MNTYTFKNSNGTMVERSDGAFIPWDSTNNRPLGGGDTGRIWVGDGSPIPAPYVAPPLTPDQLYAQKIAAGVAVTFTTSSSLNGTYAIDDTAQFHITAERVSTSVNAKMSNGTTTRNWPLIDGVTYKLFNITQFNAFATAIAAYVDSLRSTAATLKAGGTATWPAATITVAA